MSEIPPFLTMALMSRIAARRAAGQPVFRFDLGEPGEMTPLAARSAVARAVMEGPMGYTETPGRSDLRARLSVWYGETYGADVDAERIVLTGGASAALMLAILAGFPPGAGVILPRPSYPAYRNQLLALGRQPIELRCGHEEGFRLSAQALVAAAPGASGVLIASPGNPTGTMMAEPDIKALIGAARQRGLRVISDEIYHGLTYGTPCWTAAACEDVFVVNSFSKYWRMTGWRLGWLVAPSDLAEACRILAQNLFLCPSAPAQVAALSALEASAECATAVGRYAANRDRVLATLRSLGVSRWAEPEGAFYVYADLSPLTDDTLSYAHRLLDETGVAIAPGLDFDPVEGGTWARFALTAAPDDVVEGLRRLTAWAGTRQPLVSP